MYEIKTSMTTEEKLEILADAAKYDVACTSSGVDRKGKKGRNWCKNQMQSSFMERRMFLGVE